MITKHPETADKQTEDGAQGCCRPFDGERGTSLPAVWTWVARTVRGYRRAYGLLRRAMADLAPTKTARTIEINQERLAHEYSRGYLAGWRECFEECLEAVEDEIARTDEIWRIGAALAGSKEIRRKN